MSPRPAAAVLLVAALASPARALTSGVTPEIDALVRQGVDGIYAMDFDGAQRTFTALKALSAQVRASLPKCRYYPKETCTCSGRGFCVSEAA